MRLTLLAPVAAFLIASACGSAEPAASEPAPDDATTGGSTETPAPPDPAAACPATAPTHGAPCSNEGQQCGYGGGDSSAADLTDNALTCTCGGGAWSCAGAA